MRRLVTQTQQYFSGKDHRVYLLGNPVIWWGNIAFLVLFGLTYLWNLVREQRGHVDPDPSIRDAHEKLK